MMLKYRISVLLKELVQYSELLERRIFLDKSIQVDSSVKIFPEAKIRNLAENPNLIRVNKNSVIRGELLVFAHSGEINIGADCYVGEGAKIWSSSSIQIGDRVLISHNVNIHDTNSHSLDPTIRQQHFKAILTSGHPRENTMDICAKSIVVEDDVWIGFNSIILKGVKIGKGAIIAAGSVVTHDVPEFTVIAGNPAQVVKYLCN